VDARVRELAVRFTWVRGHHGHPVNEIVDELAQSAARGVRGPTQQQVIAALKASAILAG
jgi:ribonuclease HI